MRTPTTPTTMVVVTVGAWGVLTCGAIGCGSPEVAGDPQVAEDVRTVVPLEEPIFSVSEGASPVPWVVNMAIGGAILSDGVAVVANYNERLLIGLDTLGRGRFVTGRQGGGPGEFTGAVGTILPVGSGFGAWDAPARRFSFFDADGRYTHALSLEEWLVPRPGGWMPSHGLVLTQPDSDAGQPRSYEIVDSTGVGHTAIVGPPTASRFTIRYPSGRGGFLNSPMDDECTAAQFAAVGGEVLYIAESGAGTVRAVRPGDPSGGEVIYREAHRQTVTDDILQEIQGRFPSAASESLEPYLTAIGRPGDPLPTWSAIHADDVTRLLLLRETRCDRSAPGGDVWTVVDIAGRFLGRVSLPPDASLLAARAGRLLVVRRDELGVQHAELYRLDPSIWDGA